MNVKKLIKALAIAGLIAPGVALATDGYFAHGYGMKAKGMGGAATATASDTFGGANNPASMVFVGDRIDLGAEVFSPRRSISRTGSAGGAGFFDGSVDSDSNYFLIPEFGYNKMINPNLALGVTVYGNGGMNTDYASGQTDLSVCGGGAPGGPSGNMLCGVGPLGVDLMQLIIAPTIAYKIAPNHAIGISPLIGYQRFKAEGIQAFSAISSDPANLSNRGHDDSFGYGVRVGYQGKITPTLSIGVAYASKMKFEEFDKYKGLFAEQGGFDIPENFSLGAAWQATPQVLVALDYQRINYGGVASVSNSSQQPGCPGSGCLGGSSGIGFGWSDIDVWKLGVEYKYDKNWTFRGGYNHSDNPIQSRDVTFNMLAPGVVQDHLTLGFTHTFATGNELTMSYMHAFKNDVTGPTNPTYFPVGGTEKIQMYQNSLGIAYSWKM